MVVKKRSIKSSQHINVLMKYSTGNKLESYRDSLRHCMVHVFEIKNHKIGSKVFMIDFDDNTSTVKVE